MNFTREFLESLDRTNRKNIRALELMLEPGMRLFIHYKVFRAYVKNDNTGFIEAVDFSIANSVSLHLQESNSGTDDRGLWKSFKIKTLPPNLSGDKELEDLYSALDDDERGWVGKDDGN